jgi:NhaP-type Na+/H+ or K+/H+ antiporter
MGQTAEAAVYSQIAISLYFTIPKWWSFEWIAIQLVIVVVGRIVAICFVYYAALLYFKKQTITFGELMFIAYGGMIRGAIAFALVMKIPHIGSPDCKVPDFCFAMEEYDLAVSTTLALVMVTTLLFGTFMGAASKWLTVPAGPPEEPTSAELKPLTRATTTRKTGKSAHTAYKSMMSHYDEIIHPNLEK